MKVVEKLDPEDFPERKNRLELEDDLIVYNKIGKELPGKPAPVMDREILLGLKRNT